MRKQPRFGIRLPVAGALASPTAIRRVAVEAERLGFDSVWVHDYIIWTRKLDRLHISCGSREAADAAGEHFPPLFFESVTNLAFLAGITSTIRLGVAVLCLPHREPILAAKQVANVDALSGGRLELGVGPGAAKGTHNEEPEVLGISRASKYARTREYLQAMLKLWTDDAPSLEGRFVNFPPATVYPKPVQQPHPPIWIGGSREKSLELVAEFADGWIPNWIAPAAYPSAIESLGERMARSGRDVGDLTVGTEVQVALADTTEQARRLAARTMGVFEEGGLGKAGAFADPAAQDRQERMWRASLIGAPGEVREELHRYVEAGCTFFEMKFIYRDVEHLLAQMATFAGTIAPDFSAAEVPA